MNIRRARTSFTDSSGGFEIQGHDAMVRYLADTFFSYGSHLCLKMPAARKSGRHPLGSRTRANGYTGSRGNKSGRLGCTLRGLFFVSHEGANLEPRDGTPWSVSPIGFNELTT
jgi:hypothetical protein